MYFLLEILKFNGNIKIIDVFIEVLGNKDVSKIINFVFVFYLIYEYILYKVDIIFFRR